MAACLAATIRISMAVSAYPAVTGGMAGMGGTLVELIRDVSFSITPLTDTDVDDMLDALKTKSLLTGYRGSSPMDIASFKDLLFRVSAMVEDLPEISELDLNPVFVRPHGVSCVDVRMRLSALS